MKKRFVLFFVLVMSFFLISTIMCSNVFAQKKPVVIRLVVATPEGDWPMTFRDKEMAKRFNDRAKSEYIIEVHAGGALAKLPEFFDAVRIGAVEMACSPWGMFSFLDARMGLLETPFLFTNNHAANTACKLLTPVFDQVLQEKFNAKGLKIMNTGGLGLWSQKPIRTLEEMKALLVATVSPSTSSLFKNLGASPVTIMFTDIYESLQKKVVDSASMDANGGIAFAYLDVCKHYTAFYGMPSLMGYSINLDVWKKMPPHIEKILEEETARAEEWMANVMVTQLPDRGIKILKEKGVTIHYLTPAERERWAKQLEPYKESQFSKFGELGQKVRIIVEEANKKYPYVPDKGVL